MCWIRKILRSIPPFAIAIGLRISYFREVKQLIPFTESIIHADKHLLVVDKPHLSPAMPAGRYAEETLLSRLIHRLDNPQFVPLYGINRETARLVLFSANPASRTVYQTLFFERKIEKCY